MNFKRLMAGATVGAAVLASPAAFAGFTGNAGAFSSYMFRGIDQIPSGGAAVQGGVDYAHASGFYAGTWVSSLDGGAYETDLYTGFSGKAGDLTYDLGYIFYGYRDFPKGNFSEIYAGISFSGFSTKLYFSPEFYTSEDEGFYITASYAIALSETLTLTPQVGYSFGDGIEGESFTDGEDGCVASGTGLFGGCSEDSYMDYSLALAKTIEGGYTFTFAVSANSEDDILGKEQIWVGIKKGFDL